MSSRRTALWRRRSRGCSTRRKEDLIEATTSKQQKKVFTITAGSATEDVHGRKTAVEAAKERSSRTGRPIHVERDDGRVMMEFRRGQLQNYRYETRPKRRRS